MSPILQNLYHPGFTLADDLTSQTSCHVLNSLLPQLICISPVQTLQSSPALPGNVGVLVGVLLGVF